MPLQLALSNLQNEWLGRQLLYVLGDRFDVVTERFLTEDPYHEVVVLRKCLKLVTGETSDQQVKDWFRHRLWCCRRDLALSFPLPDLKLHVDGSVHAAIAETEGRPTILLGPMTLSQVDALKTMKSLFPTRPIVVFGEGVSSLGEFDAAGDGIAAARKIFDTLAKNGVLATYADFAYGNHQSVAAAFFQVMRPFASGMLSAAMRPGTCVLPFTCSVSDSFDSISVSIEEPFSFTNDSVGELADQKKLAAQVFAQVLERLIRRRPTQWLLLPTLCFESPQIAQIRVG